MNNLSLYKRKELTDYEKKAIKIVSILTSIVFSLAINEITITKADNNSIILGDLNGDYFVNAVDASLVLSY